MRSNRRRSNRRRSSRRCERGFTLFEVLGAVALLAIVYTMLSTAAIRGLKTEGKSRRILEASLLADRVLAELELGLDRQEMPELGMEESESEDGLYYIQIEVMEFEMPEIPSVAIPFGSAPPGLSLDASQVPASAPFGGSGVSPLREIRVRVGWDDPDDELYVERSTFGIDPLAIELAEGPL